MVLARKKRLELLLSAYKFVSDALNLYPFQSAALTPQIAICSEALDLTHGDPADRLIVATAIAYQAKLITCDQLLLDFARMCGDIFFSPN